MSAALSFEDISAGYSGAPVLAGVTMAFAAGKVTGLLGPNGAGKTTLFRVALRLLTASSGDIRVLDRPVSQWSGGALARAIAYLPQESETHWPVEVRKLVALGRLPHRAPFAPLSATDDEAVEESLLRCDALEFARRPVSDLSAGERARVLLARALAVAAPILLVDEPAAHLDPAHQLRLMELLRAEAARGTAVAVTLHDLTLASRFCDDVVILHGGGVAAHGPPSDTLSDDILQSVFSINVQRIESSVVPWQRI